MSKVRRRPPEPCPLSTVYVTLIVLAGLGIVFGMALAIVAARFVVKVDPKVEQVRETPARRKLRGLRIRRLHGLC